MAEPVFYLATLLPCCNSYVKSLSYSAICVVCLSIHLAFICPVGVNPASTVVENECGTITAN